MKRQGCDEQMTTDDRKTGDLITLTGLEAIGHHGVFDHERAEGQRFVVDVRLSLDTGPAARTDDLSATVDYGSLAQRVHDVVAGEPVNLIETLAERIATVCLADPSIGWVQVTVHKPDAPIAVAFDDVAVTIERSNA